MLTFKTKAEALAGTPINEAFILEDRPDAVFSVRKINKTKYIARIFGSKTIIELADALTLAEECGLHVERVETTNVFVDDAYGSNGKKIGQCKRIISAARVIDTTTNLSYIRTGSAGSDNVGKTMGTYVNEISNKRAIVRTILAALKMHDVYVDIEFSEDVDNIIKERNEKTKANFSGEKLAADNPSDKITDTQITAINNLLKTSKTKLSDILTGYKVKALSSLTQEQGKIVINTLRKRGAKDE
jgi:enamine deaminase RidA (YjgF/YER057c/UK114 family)